MSIVAGELGFEPRVFAFRAQCPAVRRLPTGFYALVGLFYHSVSDYPKTSVKGKIYP